MTKKEIVTTLQVTLAKKGIELSASNANTVLDTVLDTVRKLTVKEGKLGFVGFGTFSVRKRAARKGINPSTKEKIKIPAKKVAVFKASKSFIGKK